MTECLFCRFSRALLCVQTQENDVVASVGYTTFFYVVNLTGYLKHIKREREKKLNNKL